MSLLRTENNLIVNSTFDLISDSVFTEAPPPQRCFHFRLCTWTYARLSTLPDSLPVTASKAYKASDLTQTLCGIVESYNFFRRTDASRTRPKGSSKLNRLRLDRALCAWLVQPSLNNVEGSVLGCIMKKIRPI